jgi:hypothetical protein
MRERGSVCGPHRSRCGGDSKRLWPNRLGKLAQKAVRFLNIPGELAKMIAACSIRTTSSPAHISFVASLLRFQLSEAVNVVYESTFRWRQFISPMMRWKISCIVLRSRTVSLTSNTVKGRAVM